MPMPDVNQFSDGVLTPSLSLVMAFVGCLLGLYALTRARRAIGWVRRTRWGFFASCAIGGAGIWLMHVTAMFGFDVTDTPIRYDLGLTLASFGVAVALVGFGVITVIGGDRSAVRLVGGGVFTGVGIVAMHYTGMASVRLNGSLSYDVPLTTMAGILAVAGSIAGLWLGVRTPGWGRFVGGAAVMAVTISSVHYLAMAALRVQATTAPVPVPGIQPSTLVLPVLLVSVAALMCVLFGALDMIGDDEFRLRVRKTPPGGVDAETGAYALSLATIPSPRPPPAAPAPYPPIHLSPGPWVHPAPARPPVSPKLQSHRR